MEWTFHIYASAAVVHQTVTQSVTVQVVVGVWSYVCHLDVMILVLVVVDFVFFLLVVLGLVVTSSTQIGSVSVAHGCGQDLVQVGLVSCGKGGHLGRVEDIAPLRRGLHKAVMVVKVSGDEVPFSLDSYIGGWRRGVG